MTSMQPLRFKTISEFHQFRGMPKPEHPLISVIKLDALKQLPPNEAGIIKDFYSISLKRNFNVRMKYGQQDLDFTDGVMFFMAPGQILKLEPDPNTTLNHSGWMLLIHPDFLWNTSLAKGIKQYEYFDYAVTEALFLSEKEEMIISGILENIQQEYHSNIDKFSQNIIIAQLEVLLSYSERFYQRQFITRKKSNHEVLERLENLLRDWFNHDTLSKSGLPTVRHIAESLNVSPGYLSGLLKTLTGKSTQQHIHDCLIDKAKERLSTTALTVSEIAYELGFEHPQSFSKLFKTKTSFSPLEFRQSFV